MKSPVHYWLIYVNIAISNFQIKTTIWIRANPSFKLNARSLAAKIGKRYQVADLTFLTFWERHLVQRSHLPTMTNFT